MADRIKNYQQEADQITTLKAIRTDLGVTPSSYTPDATVVTKDRVVTFAQAEEELVVLSDIEKGVKQQIVDVDIAQKDISNIKALLQGNLYDYQTDSTIGYTKTVPSGAMPYAGLEQIGGKTLVWNQGCPYINNDNWVTNWTVSFVDGVATFTAGVTYGTLESKSNKTILPIIGHKYYMSAEVNFNSLPTATYRFDVGNSGYTSSISITLNNVVSEANVWTKVSKIATYQIHEAASINRGCFFQDYQPDGERVTIQVRKAMLIDLTLLYGAGNEPSSVAEFEAMFPSDYYEYNAGELLSAGVTSVVSKDSNNATLQTYSIPASIQALEGYGWSAGSVFNYIDYEAKKFVKRVARVDLGTLNWTYDSENTRFVNTSIASSIKKPASSADKANIICAKYNADIFTTYVDKEIAVAGTGNLFVKDSDYTTANSFATANNGTYLYYELATPVEVDTSAYLTDDNLIEVEAGGSLTFPNSNGTDYQIPVPSAETYMINLQEAVSNG